MALTSSRGCGFSGFSRLRRGEIFELILTACRGTLYSGEVPHSRVQLNEKTMCPIVPGYYYLYNGNENEGEMSPPEFSYRREETLRSLY